MEIVSEKDLKSAEKKVKELRDEIVGIRLGIQKYHNTYNMPSFKGDCKSLRSHLISGCEDGDLLEIGGVPYSLSSSIPHISYKTPPISKRSPSSQPLIK